MTLRSYLILDIRRHLLMVWSWCTFILCR